MDNWDSPPDLQEWMERYEGYRNIPWADWDRAVAPWADGYLKPYWVTIGFRTLQNGARGKYDGRAYIRLTSEIYCARDAQLLVRSRHNIGG
jgi:hypothetical protein